MAFSVAAMAWAGTPAAKTPLAVEAAWVRATPPGMTMTAGYMTLTNAGEKPLHVIAASTPRARAVEFHETRVEGAVSKMAAIDELVVPAKGSLTLEPASRHLMILGLEEPLKPGTSLPLELTVKDHGKVKVDAFVKDAAGDEHAHHHHHHSK